MCSSIGNMAGTLADCELSWSEFVVRRFWLLWKGEDQFDMIAEERQCSKQEEGNRLAGFRAPPDPKMAPR